MAQQTAKEKAQELINKYLNKVIHFPYIDTGDGNCLGYGYMTHNSAKNCALIAVDEILKLVSNDLDLYYKDCIYWEQVKTELEKL